MQQDPLVISMVFGGVNVALLYARRSIVHRATSTPKSPTIFTLSPTASATPTFLRLSEHPSSSNAVCHYCPHGTALHYDGLQLYYLPKRILNFLCQFHKHTQPTASATPTFSPF